MGLLRLDVVERSTLGLDLWVAPSPGEPDDEQGARYFNGGKEHIVGWLRSNRQRPRNSRGVYHARDDVCPTVCPMP